MTAPFAKPSASTGIEWKDYKGDLLLFRVHGIEASIPTVHGETSAVRADVVVLSGSEEGTEHADTLVFPKVLQSQIKGQVGGMVLGRLGQGQKKPGQSAPWTLGEYDDADAQTAMAYLEKNTETPF